MGSGADKPDAIQGWLVPAATAAVGLGSPAAVLGGHRQSRGASFRLLNVILMVI